MIRPVTVLLIVATCGCSGSVKEGSVLTAEEAISLGLMEAYQEIKAAENWREAIAFIDEQVLTSKYLSSDEESQWLLERAHCMRKAGDISTARREYQKQNSTFMLLNAWLIEGKPTEAYKLALGSTDYVGFSSKFDRKIEESYPPSSDEYTRQKTAAMFAWIWATAVNSSATNPRGWAESNLYPEVGIDSAIDILKLHNAPITDFMSWEDYVKDYKERKDGHFFPRDAQDGFREKRISHYSSEIDDNIDALGDAIAMNSASKFHSTYPTDYVGCMALAACHAKAGNFPEARDLVRTASRNAKSDFQKDRAKEILEFYIRESPWLHFTREKFAMVPPSESEREESEP